MSTPHRAAVAALCVLLAACGGGPPSLDLTGGPSDLLASRSELEARAGRLEASGASAGSDSGRALADVRRRLAQGDFRLDDRILLFVDGEATLTDTFAVDAAQNVTLPGIGLVSLQGVLRSELENRMREEVGRMLRQPVVRARSLIRIGVTGAVRRAGYVWVPADGQLADVITATEGYTPDAQQAEIYVERDGEKILSGVPLQRVFREGQTLDRAGLEGGDQLVVPVRGGMTSYERVRLVAILLTIPITIYTLTQIFSK